MEGPSSTDEHSSTEVPFLTNLAFFHTDVISVYTSRTLFTSTSCHISPSTVCFIRVSSQSADLSYLPAYVFITSIALHTNVFKFATHFHFGTPIFPPFAFSSFPFLLWLLTYSFMPCSLLILYRNLS